MDFFKYWIMGICGCTVLVSLICSLIPKTSTARLLRVCGMILMVFAVFAPLKTISPEDLQIKINNEFFQTADDVMAKNEELEISIIEEKLGEYILQRANQIGVDCEVSVSVRKDKNGLLLPQKIEIYGTGKTEELQRAIEVECGIKPTVKTRK